MQQEQIPKVPSKPGKELDSKKFLIIIIVMLSVALVLLGVLYIYNISKNSQVENEVEKDSATLSTSENNTLSNGEIAPATSTTAEPEPTILIEAKKADLYVKSYTFSKDPKVDSKFTVKVVIGNKGQVASEESYWEWWATASKQGCKKKVGAIVAGGSSAVECEYTYSDWDDYTTKVIVDSQDDVDESNENNNVATEGVTPIHSKADLIITDYSFNHDPVMAEEFKVRITIKNSGQTDAKDFKWEWWSNAHSSSCDGKINKLEADDSTTVSCDYTYAGWSTYATKAVVDVDDDVDESDEGNNASTKTVVPIH